jgi:hypothetical protein
VVTNLTGTASININGTVGATTANTGAFTTLTSSSDATLHGLTVGRGAGAVSTNTAVGASALAANTSGLENVAIGISALSANTTGAQNTATGRLALRDNTTGNDNTATGALALLSNTTGLRNTASGEGALRFNTTGNDNAAFGRDALRNNTTATNNTAVGYQAGYSNTTDTSIVALGYQALYGATVSSSIVAIGHGALGVATGCFASTVVGDGAGRSVTTGDRNTLIGQGAGSAITTGQANTIVGPRTPGGTEPGGAITTGSKNTIIGGFNGNQGGLDIRTASNYIVLSDGGGNPRGIFDGSGNYYVTGGGAYAAVAAYIGTALNGATAQGGIGLSGGAAGLIDTGHADGTASGTSYSRYIYNGSVIGSITQSGTSAVLFNVTSDQRLKENIIDAPEFGSVIDSLQVRSFDWKTDNTHQRAGFIAQELVTVAPEAVHQPADPEEMMAVDYSKLVPMLIKEIQDLRKRLAAAGI